MFTPESYTIAAALFVRLLGFIYLFAFGAFLFQIKGLLGSHGVQPITKYLHWIRNNYPKRCYYLVPSVFWLNSSDRALMFVVSLGVGLSVLLIFGVLPSLLLLLLYILYLSIVSTGQDFLSFGWEGFLLEVTLNAFFLSLTTPPNLMMWISLNLVLFRFHFQGGAVKLQSQDPNWRNLTAVWYHYLSQPIPNTIAWYAHKLPMWFHKLSTLGMFIVELIIPFAMFGNDLVRLIVFFSFVGLQLMIWMTGNFSFLNHLTVVLSVILVANAYLAPWFSAPPAQESLFGVDLLCTVVGTALVILQAMHLWQGFVPNPLFKLWLGKLSPFHITNRYGIFAVMTTKRYEVVFEGSQDGIHWKEYGFFYKPSEIERRPRRISPYQPRVDWQAWFLPLGSYKYDTWFGNFIYHLLLGSPEVLKLIRVNPFPDHPPKYVRTSLYDYTYTSAKEKKASGRWWNRKYVGEFTRPNTLKH